MECFLYRERGPFTRNLEAWIPVSTLLQGGSLLTLALSPTGKRGQVGGQESLQFLPDAVRPQMFRLQESSGIQTEVGRTLGLSRHHRFSALEPKSYYTGWGKPFLLPIALVSTPLPHSKALLSHFLNTKFFLIFFP